MAPLSQLDLMLRWQVQQYDGKRFFAPLKKASQLTEVIYKNQFMSLDKDVLVSDDGVTWTKILDS